MSENKFGERYFATRASLSKVMHGIAELADITQTDLVGHLPFSEMESGLGTPFLFVVCGEVNAGKSTLINGLFGRDLCRVNVLPETARVLWYRYGKASEDQEITPLLEQRFRPIDFLKDFNLIDTPGTNSIVKDHQDITEKFLPTADLILFVFPVSNPWGAATWDLITRLPAECLSRIVFIIQQADQRDAIDLEVILGHMTALSVKRIGQVVPIFAVSGKLAYEAKRVTPFAADLLRRSGYLALQRFISKNVCESAARQGSLSVWRDQAAAALRAVEDRIEDQTRELETQSHFLEQVEREIDEIREHFVTRLPTHLASVAEIFESEALWVSQKLSSKLAAIPSLFRLFVGDRTGHEMESIFIGRLQAAVEAVAGKDGDEVVKFCREHWEDLTPRVREATAVDLGAAAPLAETLHSAKARFVLRLGRAARQGINDLKVRNQLDKELRSRNVALKSFTVVTLALLTGGAICGGLGLPWIPLILCSLALLFLGGGLFTAISTRKAITEDFRKRLLDTCGSFATTLRADYEDALRIVFQDYLTTLAPVHSHLVEEKIAVGPILKRWQELFLTLKAVEQDL